MHYLNIAELSERLRAKQLSVMEVTENMLHRIDVLDGELCSYLSVVGERARRKAREAQAEIDRGQWRGPLHGVPIALKDLIDTTFAPTTAGMALRKDWVPASNATVVERLEAAGAIILGKLSTTEGALASHHPALRTPRNPWHAEYWTGISSSGSGVATAAGLCFGSLGTDTGGSVRFPAAACGLTGLKPTWGRVSRHGVFPLAETLDHVGPLARTAEDAAILLQAIAGHDGNDRTSLSDPVPDYLSVLDDGIDGVRVGCDESLVRDIDGEVQAAIAAAMTVLTAAGARIVPVQVPSLSATLAPHFKVMAAEAAVAHRETFPAQAAQYTPGTAQMLQRGRDLSGMDVARAGIERREYCGALEAVFHGVDLLIVPVIQTCLPRRDLTIDASTAMFTSPFNLTGSPCITLRGGTDSAGLPLGFQLVGRHLAEALLLRAGVAYQRETQWHLLHPTLTE